MSSDPRCATIDGSQPDETRLGTGHGSEVAVGAVPLAGEMVPRATPSSSSRLRPRLMLGRGVLIFSVLLTGVQALAIVLASNGHWLTATVLAWGVIALSCLVFITALVALIRGRARRSAGAALLLSLVSNPLVLVWLLDLFVER